MTKKIHGITINIKEELNSNLIKEEIGYIPNTENDLFKSTFITPDSIKAGNDLADNFFAETDREFHII